MAELSNVATVGTPNSFNCSGFVGLYELLVEAIEADIDNYDTTLELIDDQDDPLNQVYQQCLDEGDRDYIKISPSLFQQMRRDVQQLS